MTVEGESMNIPDLINDFLVEVREHNGFANDKNFDRVAAEVFKQKIKDVVEECAKIADEEVAARRECLNASAKRNDSYSFAGHTYAITAAENIGKEIRALAGVMKDDGPDDRFDIGGFECNEKQED